MMNDKPNNRMGGMGRSPSGDRFRDRGGPGGMMPGRGDRFHDEPPNRFDDNFRNMPPMRDGVEPFPKHPRFDGPIREPMGGPNQFPDFFKDNFMGGPGPGPIPKVNDCEIIVLNRLLQGYAELVEQRLKNLGLSVDMMFVRDEQAIIHALSDVVKRGSFYSIIITNQNEVHGSLTLNILRGPVAQEHRNMPLDDALKLISRTFGQMREEKRMSEQPPVIDREIHFMLTLLLNGKYLTLPELDRIARYVQEIRERQSNSEKLTMGGVGASDVAVKTPDAENNLSDQQNLQQRILSIISQGNPVTGQATAQVETPAIPNMMPKTAITNPSVPASGAATGVPPTNTYINFDNPSVQKALDSLMSSGPNLLKNIANTTPGINQTRGSTGQTGPQNMLGNNPMNQGPQGMMGGSNLGPGIMGPNPGTQGRPGNQGMNQGPNPMGQGMMGGPGQQGMMGGPGQQGMMGGPGQQGMMGGPGQGMMGQNNMMGGNQGGYRNQMGNQSSFYNRGNNQGSRY